jgi:biopolymer transport protein ExbD
VRLSKRRRSHGVGFDLTPMIDVVFQLIIFFMTCAQAAVAENEAVDLPELAGSQDASERDLVVNVALDPKTKAERVVVSGKDVTPAEVAAKARELIAKKGADKVTVGLRVDRKARSRTVNELVSALKGAGIGGGRIVVEPSQGLLGQ